MIVPHELERLKDTLKAIEEVNDRLADLEDGYGAHGFDTDLITLGNQLYDLQERIETYIKEETES